MLNVVLAELKKMSRASILMSTFLIIGTLSIGLTSFIFLKHNTETWQELAKFDGVTASYNMVTVFMGFVALTIFASQTAQEYTFGTLRNLLVRQPSRIKLFVGKFLAMSAFALLFVLFTFLLNVGLSYILAKYQHFDLSAWTSSRGLIHAENMFVNTTLALIGYGSFGMALGMIMKSPMAAISTSLLWFLIVEGILGSLIKGSSKWMPGNAFAVINDGGMQSLSYTRGLTIAAGYVIVIMTISGYLFYSRDVAQ